MSFLFGGESGGSLKLIQRFISYKQGKFIFWNGGTGGIRLWTAVPVVQTWSENELFHDEVRDFGQVSEGPQHGHLQILQVEDWEAARKDQRGRQWRRHRRRWVKLRWCRKKRCTAGNNFTQIKTHEKTVKNAGIKETICNVYRCSG